jgi:16S rRNA (uracil1498-N3)-methyltransferase
MSYFLSEKPLKPGTTYVLSKDEARHIALARRVKVGETVVLQGPDEKRFACVVTSIDKSTVVVSVEHAVTTPSEPKLQITIFQALVSEAALDTIIQKITELGATELVIFPSQHSPNSVSDKKEKKLERWNKISMEAAKQSDRVQPITITYLDSLEQAIDHAKSVKTLLLLDPESNIGIAKNSDAKSVGTFIGPEGGFSESETNLLSTRLDAQLVRFGPRILRADTAAVAATAILQATFGDMA